MKNLVVAFALLLSLASAHVLAAGEPSAEEKEIAYRTVCTPDEKQALANGSDQKTLAAIYDFLDHPSTYLRRTDAELRNKGESSPGLTAFFDLSLNCEVAGSLMKIIKSRGCVGLDGKQHDAEAAANLCTAYASRMDK